MVRAQEQNRTRARLDNLPPAESAVVGAQSMSRSSDAHGRQWVREIAHSCIRRAPHVRGYNRLSLSLLGGQRWLISTPSSLRKPLALDENIYKLRLDKLKQIEA